MSNCTKKPKAIHNLLWGILKGKYSNKNKRAQIYKLKKMEQQQERKICKKTKEHGRVEKV